MTPRTARTLISVLLTINGALAAIVLARFGPYLATRAGGTFNSAYSRAGVSPDTASREQQLEQAKKADSQIAKPVPAKQCYRLLNECRGQCYKPADTAGQEAAACLADCETAFQFCLPKTGPPPAP